MNDEIIEILENVKKCCDIMEDNNFIVYQKQDILQVLDYITNLEQKYEEADNDRHNLFEQKEKAIEYIKEDIYVEPKELYGLVDGEHLLNILKGDDKDQ